MSVLLGDDITSRSRHFTKRELLEAERKMYIVRMDEDQERVNEIDEQIAREELEGQ